MYAMYIVRRPDNKISLYVFKILFLLIIFIAIILYNISFRDKNALKSKKKI